MKLYSENKNYKLYQGSMLDMLEDNVDEKYSVSPGLLKCFMSEGTGKYPRKERFFQNINRPNQDIANSITTLEGNRPTCTFIPKVLGGYGKIGTTGQYHQQNRVYADNVAISVTTAFNQFYKNDLRIRKLTPKECFRLMGVRDEDFEKCAKNQSDSSLYHLAGDSIVVNVLMAIFKDLL